LTHSKESLVDFFRKYSFLIILAVPLFIGATTMQHTLDLQNFLPIDQASANTHANPAGEVLEEISSEDDIHSLYLMKSHSEVFCLENEYIPKETNTLNQIVPTPPPDII